MRRPPSLPVEISPPIYFATCRRTRRRGAAWTVDVRNVRRASTDGHDYWVAALEFTPPRGASARDLVLVDDAVTHEVRNHVVTVLARSDAASSGDDGPQLLGVLQYPARSLEIHRR